MSITLMQEVLRKYLRDVFFETGTNDGGGVEVALAVGFQQVYTCDCDAENVRRARNRFPPEKVQVFQGESPHALADALPRINGSVTFWLDAHDDSPRLEPTPLLKELTVIFRALRNERRSPLSLPALLAAGERSQGSHNRRRSSLTVAAIPHPAPAERSRSALGQNVILIDDLRILGVRDTWGERLSVKRLLAHIRRLDPMAQFAYEDNRLARQDILVVHG
jgi:hypothetical protein